MVLMCCGTSTSPYSYRRSDTLEPSQLLELRFLERSSITKAPVVNLVDQSRTYQLLFGEALNLLGLWVFVETRHIKISALFDEISFLFVQIPIFFIGYPKEF